MHMDSDIGTQPTRPPRGRYHASFFRRTREALLNLEM